MSDAAREAVADVPPVHPPGEVRVTPYSCYVLAVIVIVGILNHIDRVIISILAEKIRIDLNISDAQLGFLYGTAFAVFFAVVGIPMGRMADAVSRKNLMAAGLGFWSLMTTLCGVATNFAQLAAARFGVGFGEATANPCSHSLMSHYFPARNRATVMAIYLCGTMSGGGFALLIGGYMIQHWDQVCSAVPFAGACGLAGWQAAFFVAGVPGLIMAILVATLREPPRPHLKKGSLLALAAREFSATVPPFTLIAAAKEAGFRGLRQNLLLLAPVVAFVLGVGFVTGDWSQWIAVGIGSYSILSWAQILRLRDRPLFELTMGCPAFTMALGGFAIIGCLNGTVHFWAAPYGIRILGMSTAGVGGLLGAGTVVGSVIGVLLGGLTTDLWRKRDVRAPYWMGLVGLIAPIPIVLTMFFTTDPTIFVVTYFLHAIASAVWGAGAGALAQDLVLPRMRGTAAACFSLTIIVITLAIGPYWAGKISTLTTSLSTGVLSTLIIVPVSAALLVFGARAAKRQGKPNHRAERAALYGEIV